ncbi:hypothetical protein J4E89_000034 [Alternaria sp. Ai002NY15]|nr:hypothetical protein J4E89_000034 [Alternaria sp. Ai002NY15]
MTNCVLRTQFALKAVEEDPEARRVVKLKLPCASVLWSIKYSREKDMNGMHDMYSIFTLMMMTRWFGAKDLRDRIFALVGLSNEIDKAFVDYSKSYEDISQEVSHMLLDGLFNEQGFHYLPMNTGYPSVDSVIKQKPEIHFSDKEVLHIRGIVFDKITHLVPFPSFGGQVEVPFDDNNVHKFAAYRDWSVRASNLVIPLGSTEPSPIYEPTGEHTSEAFWRTLCCNRSIQDAVEPPADRSGYDAFALYNATAIAISNTGF